MSSLSSTTATKHTKMVSAPTSSEKQLVANPKKPRAGKKPASARHSKKNAKSHAPMFRLARLRTKIMRGAYSAKLSKAVPKTLSEILEFFALRIFKGLKKNEDAYENESKRHKVTPRQLMISLSRDAEMSKFFGKENFIHGGVLVGAPQRVLDITRKRSAAHKKKIAALNREKRLLITAKAEADAEPEVEIEEEK